VNTQAKHAPIACTLGPDDLTARLDRIAQLARQHLLAQRQDGAALQLLYSADAAAELKDIVALEQQCCAFLKFELAERAKVVELTITAPTEAGEFAGLLFEHFSATASETLGGNRPQDACARSPQRQPGSAGNPCHCQDRP
jgi:hypothetical protein